MPVKSYLACTQPGKGEQFAMKVRNFPGCTIWPAENRDAFVIVTDTASEEAEELLRRALEALEPMAALTLVAAYAAPDDLVTIGKGSKHESA